VNTVRPTVGSVRGDACAERAQHTIAVMKIGRAAIAREGITTSLRRYKLPPWLRVR